MKKVFLIIAWTLFWNIVNGQNLCFNSVINNAAIGTPTLQAIFETTKGDFNNDGYMDIVVPSVSDLKFFKNDGTSNYIASQIGVGGTFGVNNSDLNGDGNLDLIFGWSSGGIGISMGNGDGTFNPYSVVSFTTSGPVQNIFIEDLDSDGIKDMIVRDNSNIKSLKGISPTNYSVVSTYTFANLYTFTVGNYNSDTSKDILILSNSKVFLYQGLGNLTFSSTLLFNFGTETPYDIFTEDLNGDSKLDFAMSVDDNKIISYLGTGTGNFTLSSTLVALNSGRYLKAGDFNNDGFVDFITANGLQFMGLGNGNFEDSKNYSMTAVVKNFEVVDYNNDSYDDVVYIEKNYGSAISTFKLGMADSIGIINCPKEFMVGLWPYDLAIGDFNNDHKKDIVAANYLGKPLTVLQGFDNGKFNSISNYSLSGATGAAVAEKVDFNNDGLDDFSIAYGASSTTVDGFFNNSNVSSPDFFISVSGTSKPFYGDINNDGIMDIGVNGSNFHYRFGTGNGNLSIGYSSPGFYYGVSKIIMKDANNDGINDILTGGVYIYPGIGSGAFSYTPVAVGGGDVYKDFDVGYLNNDNILDIVSSSSVGVIYYQGNGGNNFTMTTVLSYSVTKIQIADINADGKQDIIGLKDNKISILTGNGMGGFVGPLEIDVSSSYAFDIGDMNNDSMPDIAISDKNRNTVRVLINTTSKISSNSALNLICDNSSITLKAPKDSHSYTWQSSSGNSSADSLVVNSAGVFTLTTINNNGTCISSSTISVNAIPSPSLNIAITSASVCIGSSTTLTASGTNSYTWSSGSTTASIIVSPTSNATYTVSGTDMNNCSNTQTVTITVDPTCADIWPGDANSDGIADNLDVLELGLHYTQTGPVRATASNNWQSYFADNWTGTITNGKNLNHSDCNGDGTINDDDTLAIYNNYGLTHAFKQTTQPATNPQLSIVPDQAMVVKGNWGTASVYLGDAVTPISNINGIAFTVDFDNTLIETNNIYIEYETSFLNTANDNLHFRKLDFGSGKIYTATTHTNNTNVSGNGKIATLHYRIKTGLTTDEILNLGLSLANQSAATGTVTPLTTGTGTLMALGSSVGVKELNNGNIISIIPNPASSFITISSTADLKTIEVMNIAGQTVLSQKANSVTQQLNIEELANGIYMVKITGVNGATSVKRLVVNR